MQAHHASVAVVGAGDFIGAAIAKRFAAEGFVVHAGGVDVHVVGTIFSVANGPAGVEVAVAEGQVKVESERGEA